MTQLDFIANPAKYFDHPGEVLQDRSLLSGQKIRILENWKDMELARRRADSEGMQTSTRNRVSLREINQSLALARNL